jgi:hypothetical protein
VHGLLKYLVPKLKQIENAEGWNPISKEYARVALGLCGTPLLIRFLTYCRKQTRSARTHQIDMMERSMKPEQPSMIGQEQ